MGAEDHLQPRLFHGTSLDISDRVLPPNVSGRPSQYRGMGAEEHAFASEEENTAWDFAQRSSSRRSEKYRRMPGRARVYEVHPNEAMAMGEHHYANPEGLRDDEDLREWRAPHFDVASRVDIMPGRQGTFPLNWNQFKQKPNRPAWTDEYNHPSDEFVENGHMGGNMYNASLKRLYGEIPRKQAPDTGQPGLF